MKKIVSNALFFRKNCLEVPKMVIPYKKIDGPSLTLPDLMGGVEPTPQRFFPITLDKNKILKPNFG